MSRSLVPGSVLIIDDRPEETRPLLEGLSRITEIIHPTELDLSHLHNANLVLIDHDLKDEDWPERDDCPIACRPRDGIALAHLVLGHLRSPEFLKSSPTAVGILSVGLERITPGFDNVPEHISARTSGLHWTFWKTPKPIESEEPSLPTRIVEFAESVGHLPDRWQDGHQLDHFKELLGLSKEPIERWQGAALAHAMQCRPPLHELANWTSGLAVIRWLSQRILPYPTFLLNIDALALRLGVAPAWLRSNIVTDSPLDKLFRRAQYGGILSSFLGRRWWASGIDATLQDAGNNIAFSRSSLVDWLKNHADAPVRLNADETLVINERLVTDGTTAKFDDCVRLQLDDWPTFAAQPRTKIALARECPRLQMSVELEDEEKLDDVA